MKQLVVEHFEDFVNRRKATVIRKNMTPNFYDHDGPRGKPTGIDGDEKMMLDMYKIMPDLHLTIDDVIAEGDKVVCRNIWRGPTLHPARRCSSMASCSGVLRETELPSVGPP